jgi:hypothetical protein
MLMEPTLCQVLQTLKFHKPTIVVLDGNLSPDKIKTVVTYCNENEINGKCTFFVIWGLTRSFFHVQSSCKATSIITDELHLTWNAANPLQL